MGLKIGILTSGGDCQALNAAMRGVAKTLCHLCTDVKIYGFVDGYKGLVEGRFMKMKEQDFSNILTNGGTILGTSRMPFKYIDEPDEEGRDKISSMVKTYKDMALDCLVVLGGNGSHKTAGRLKKEGLNIVSLPKTIDNDIECTEATFGFMSAVDIATRTIDEIHTTAASHSRVFIVELMGHKTGWLTLNAGIAGGADIILIPEIPYNLDKITEIISEREGTGKKFTIIAVAEGAVSVEESQLSKKERKALNAKNPYPSVAYKIGAMIEEKSGREVRVTVPGHVQRGGSPNAYDRILATRLGTAAAELILNKEYGYMVCVKDGQISKVAIEEVAGQTKKIKKEDRLIAQAEMLGICLGR